MAREMTLFGDETTDKSAGPAPFAAYPKTEVKPLDSLQKFEEKIGAAIEKVKALKEEKSVLERKIRELESMLNDKIQEIEALRSEKRSISGQIEDLINELETIEI